MLGVLIIVPAVIVAVVDGVVVVVVDGVVVVLAVKYPTLICSV